MRGWCLFWVSIVLFGCNPGSGTAPVTYRQDLANLKLPQTPFDYTPALPGYFTDSTHPRYAGHYDNMPAGNPTTDAGATLGRVLFYDTRLSANNTISCASCHQQNKGFSDDAVRSEGFQGGLTGRHSMGLANARYYPNGRFFWDERAPTLEAQVLMPIQDPVEMGMSLSTLTGLLSSTPEYPVLFTEAYGSADITEERIARALAQFVRSMISYQTKFDEGVDTNWQNLTTDETEGAFLFSGMCAKCHQGTLQSSKGAANNGLDVESVFDLGTGGDTDLAEDVGKFKIPSLRNVAVTAPYMHDGRFATLEQVIRHYLTGVQAHENLDARLQVNGSPQYLPLSQKQIEQLMAFLNTLTDHALLTDEKFSNPFVNSF